MQKPVDSVRYHSALSICVLMGCLLSSGGCGPTLSSAEHIKRFEQAGPIKAETDFPAVAELRAHSGPYHVIPGDVLEFQMPAVLRVISSDLPEWLRPTYGRTDVEPYLVRVNEAGAIALPIAREVAVAGKTLAEVEAAVIDAYHPKYVVNPPMVVCEVKRYRSENERVFAVVGLVNKSGIFPYPPDVQYNLMEALAFAGGLDMVADPRYLKIYRQDTSGEIVSVTYSLNPKSLAGAYGLVIKPGDVIYVDHTLSTRVNKFLSDVFHVTIGAETRYSDW